MAVLVGDDDLAGGGIQGIGEAVLVEVDHHLAGYPGDVRRRDDAFIDRVVVPAVVRGDLVGPDRLAGIRVAREDHRTPLVVARAHVRVPDAGVGRPVVEQVEIRVVGEPGP